MWPGSRPGTPHHFQHKTQVLPQLLTRLKSVKDKAHDRLSRHSSTSSRHSSHPLTRNSSTARSPTHKISPITCHPHRSTASLALANALPSPAHPSTLARQRPALKIRLVTMNMHDELPLGDLSDFLGEVRAFRAGTGAGAGARPSQGARSSVQSSSRAGSVRSLAETGSLSEVPGPDDLPRYPLEDGHPYHVVVVAAQECPLASGVTSGKLNTSRQAWTNTLETWLCGGTETEVKQEEAEEAGKDGDQAGEEEEMLDWEEERRKVAERVAAGADNTSVHSRVTSAGDQDEDDDQPTGRGPYVLVEKERLMGIYIAVFVARSCDHLITGTSKAKVTAGLIGGRLGNKGGVGVSLAIAGSRLLFVSAHLAAHASASEIRKANVHKILTELEVDDFLPPDDERKKETNVSNKFDQTFFLGDLNFRLDISRLHADWLTKSHNYTTALEFDQLRKVMKEENGVFDGFTEAPIAFGPTYKYDLPKRVTKRASRILRSPGKGKRSSRDWRQLAVNEEHDETPPQTPLTPSPLTTGPSPMIPQDFAALEGLTSPPEEATLLVPPRPKEDDAVSIASTISADFSDLDHLQLVDAQGSAVDLSNGVEVELPTGPGGSMEKLDLGSPRELEKAKVKFMTLVKANSAAFGKRAALEARDTPVKSNSAPVPAARKHSHSLSGGKPPHVLASRPPLRSSLSEMVVSHSSDDLATPALQDTEAEPVFDSSSKQRVQSYTDRILWKSTVPVPEPLPAPTPVGTGSRRASLFVDTVRAVMAGHKSGSAVDGTPVNGGPGLNRSWTTGDTTLPASTSASIEPDNTVAMRLNKLFARHTPQRSVSMTQPSSPTGLDSPTGVHSATRSPAGSPGLTRPEGMQRARSLGQREPRKLVRRAQSASPAREKSRTQWAPLGLGRPAGVVVGGGSAGAGQGSPLVNSPGAETVQSLTSATPTGPAGATPPKAVDFSTKPVAATSPAITDHSRSPSSYENPFSRALSTPATSPPNTRSSSANHISFPAEVTAVGSRPVLATRHSQPAPDSGTGTGATGDRHGFLRGAAAFPRTLSALTTRDHSDAAGGSPPAGPLSAASGAGSGLTRLRSFFHLPALQTMRPLSLLDRADTDGESDGGGGGLAGLAGLTRREAGPTGPRKGDVVVLRYDAITDLKKMDAVSDHRPVFLSVAVGVGGGDGEE